MAPSNDNQRESHENLYADIGKINELPKEEFKRQIQEWMETQQPKLQSKLRKDLIETFTKTNLGRQINSTLQSKQGIVLSPMSLVLNTLVSEFLHSQDYHFTLCVFSTEVCFAHTLPDFSKPDFSFSRKELHDIFVAIGVSHLSALTTAIMDAYENAQEQEKSHKSLLFAVMKTLIDEMKRIKEEKFHKQIQAPTSSIQQSAPTPKAPKKPPRHQHFSDSDEVNINIGNLKTLNHTIEKLSKSVKNMAKHYMELETSRISSKSQCNHSKLDLEREEKHYYNLMRHIQSISQKLDKCVVNFAGLEEKLNGKCPGSSNFEKMRYKEWLEMMRDSKNGQKYIDKFQRSIARLWEAEKAKLKKYYEDKLHAERKEMKLKYKEELREQIEHKLGTHKEVTEFNKDTIKEILETKMQTIESRDENLGKKLDKLEEIVHEYKDDEQKKKDEIKKMAQKLTETLRTVEKTVQKVPESIVYLEKKLPSGTGGYEMENEVDQIIKNAKCRIKTLEQEGEALEKSFANYLQRQKDKKESIETERIRLWQNYQTDRLALKANLAPRTSTPYEAPATITASSPDRYLHYDDMVADINGAVAVTQNDREINVSNPFKTFDTAVYLQKAHEKRLLEGPKIERLEAYRRLDREVESIKRRVYTDQGLQSKSVGSSYFNPSGGSIFGPARFPPAVQFPTSKDSKEQCIQTNGDQNWHGILKQSGSAQKKSEDRSITQSQQMPKVIIQASSLTSTNTQDESNSKLTENASEVSKKQENNYLTVPSAGIPGVSDKSSVSKSELDLRDVTLDLELSKTTKNSSGESSQKSPEENEQKDKRPTWAQELQRDFAKTELYSDATLYRDIKAKSDVPTKSPEDLSNQSYNDSLEVSDPDKINKTIKSINQQLNQTQTIEPLTSSEQSASKLDKQIDQMAQRAVELQAELQQPLTLVVDEKPSTQMPSNSGSYAASNEAVSSSPVGSHRPTSSLLDDKLSIGQVTSSESEKFVISTGKRSSSDMSEDAFWK